MKVALTIAAVAASAFASPTGALDARQSGQKCYSGVYIVSTRGTFEQQDITGFGFQGLIVDAVLKAIPDSNATSTVYPASVVDYGDSVRQGALDHQKKVIAYAQACPSSKIVLLGYSQGAQVVGNSLAGGGSGIPVLGGNTGPNDPLPASAGANIIAINLLGDPNRAKGQGKDVDPQSCSTASSTPRSGAVFDAFARYADRVETWCADGDPVCCVNGSDPGSHVGYLLNQDNVNHMRDFIVARYKASQ